MNRQELLQIAKPILFNTEMVQAIMDGRKTVTRRVVKPQPETGAKLVTKKLLPETVEAGAGNVYMFSDATVTSPPFQTGDILYIRETWCKGWIDVGEEPDGRDAPYIDQCEILPKTYIHKEWAIRNDIGMDDIKWKPSIHMPKEATRIFLKVKKVRVARLNEINGQQILAEGVDNGKSNPAMGNRWENMQRIRFSALWDTTIKKQDVPKYGWIANPWVWVIEFERIEVDHE